MKTIYNGIVLIFYSHLQTIIQQSGMKLILEDKFFKNVVYGILIVTILVKFQGNMSKEER